MGAENECLGCGVDFDYDLEACPECGWSPRDFAARGRYGLAKPGHGEPEDDGDGERDGGGPPPGPGGLLGS
ncbi:hypothetical protein [Haloplanus halophilus]|uniref:hypothetical protein n=1 Tax=Haloplanus halophilus TaxID=2949993 RepID=UPI002040FB49|nr:hypothetical protein [Haloplanus sp. GDY1]